jgi:hypothetical protein
MDPLTLYCFWSSSFVGILYCNCPRPSQNFLKKDCKQEKECLANNPVKGFAN